MRQRLAELQVVDLPVVFTHANTYDPAGEAAGPGGLPAALATAAPAPIPAATSTAVTRLAFVFFATIILPRPSR